jgi:hypothetical protein
MQPQQPKIPTPPPPAMPTPAQPPISDLSPTQPAELGAVKKRLVEGVEGVEAVKTKTAEAEALLISDEDMARLARRTDYTTKEGERTALQQLIQAGLRRQISELNENLLSKSRQLAAEVRAFAPVLRIALQTACDEYAKLAAQNLLPWTNDEIEARNLAEQTFAVRGFRNFAGAEYLSRLAGDDFEHVQIYAKKAVSIIDDLLAGRPSWVWQPTP